MIKFAWNANVQQMYAIYTAALKNYTDYPSIPIGLPYDGETFLDDSLEEMLCTIKMLRDAGYRVPNSVIENIEDILKNGE
jgi:hypothetical protein